MVVEFIKHPTHWWCIKYPNKEKSYCGYLRNGLLPIKTKNIVSELDEETKEYLRGMAIQDKEKYHFNFDNKYAICANCSSHLKEEEGIDIDNYIDDYRRELTGKEILEKWLLGL